MTGTDKTALDLIVELYSSSHRLNEQLLKANETIEKQNEAIKALLAKIEKMQEPQLPLVEAGDAHIEVNGTGGVH